MNKWISIDIPLNCVHKSKINIIQMLVQVMAWSVVPTMRYAFIWANDGKYTELTLIFQHCCCLDKLPVENWHKLKENHVAYTKIYTSHNVYCKFFTKHNNSPYPKKAVYHKTSFMNLSGLKMQRNPANPLGAAVPGDK